MAIHPQHILQHTNDDLTLEGLPCSIPATAAGWELVLGMQIQWIFFNSLLFEVMKKLPPGRQNLF